MGSTSLDSRVLSSAELRVSGESMEKGVITADVATHEEVTESRELFAGSDPCAVPSRSIAILLASRCAAATACISAIIVRLRSP